MRPSAVPPVGPDHRGAGAGGILPFPVALAVLLGGCVPLAFVTSPAPFSSAAPAPAAGGQAASVFEAACHQAGFGLIRANQLYRPSEPLGRIAVPRGV